MSWGNVRAYLDRVGFLLENDPQVSAVREGRLDVLNRHLEDICESFPWRFLQTEADFLVWQERTYTAALPTANTAVLLVNGSHLITFANSINTLNFTAYAAGLTFDDGFGRIYTIGAFSSATTAYLTDAYAGGTGNNTTWSIKTDKVLLPLDCAQPLGFIDRANGRGRLISLDRRREELYLSWDDGATGDVTWLVDGDAMYDRPPDPTLVATFDAAGGALSANSVFE